MSVLEPSDAKQIAEMISWVVAEGDTLEIVAGGTKRALGRPMKDTVEISSTGRVRQTAFRADMVERAFGVAGGEDVIRNVPGSFYEFITRDDDPATGDRISLAVRIYFDCPFGYEGYAVVLAVFVAFVTLGFIGNVLGIFLFCHGPVLHLLTALMHDLR